MAFELTIVVPVLNERDNIGLLVDRLEATLAGIDWEVVFVDDDSTDGTLGVCKSLARKDDRVRFIRRIGRRGLSSACLEGMATSASLYFAVMDGDLQHDETLLPEMLRCLRAGEADLVVGSRYMEDGGSGSGSQSKTRRQISVIGGWFGRLMLKVHLSDPMSGFFMIRAEVFENTVRTVSGMGFKILLDIVASAGKDLRIKELPFVFGPRRHGESKLDTLVLWEFLLLLIQKLVRDVLPARFIMFVIAGSLGAVLHLGVLGLGLRGLGWEFLWAQAAAAAAAMVFNYFLNNLFTYRDQRLRGGRLFMGLVSFSLICSIGAVVNVNIAEAMYRVGWPWWLAGLVGAAIGAVWNYAVSSTLVWRLARRTAAR
ncbi:MAG: glycosyltransferase family 2 protein [Alphaproteobacteria bacterium]